MGKRIFELLDELNKSDIENNTSFVAVCPGFISADKVKGGTKISMGAPENAIYGIMNNEVMPILLLINKEEYNKLKQ